MTQLFRLLLNENAVNHHERRLLVSCIIMLLQRVTIGRRQTCDETVQRQRQHGCSYSSDSNRRSSSRSSQGTRRRQLTTSSVHTHSHTPCRRSVQWRRDVGKYLTSIDFTRCKNALWTFWLCVPHSEPLSPCYTFDVKSVPREERGDRHRRLCPPFLARRGAVAK